MTTKAKAQPYTVDELVAMLKGNTANSMEAQLLRPRLVRMLYRQLGEPQIDDFPDEFKHASSYQKMQGYTTRMHIDTAENMKSSNRRPTHWYIARPSDTKCRIVEEYTRDGWHATVQAYNVMCDKYVQHPRFPHIWVLFYVSRDTAKYEYILECTDGTE